tara:strand:+ start:96 stop:890 length:795 start_codon:yes stop_codon:yes gene_type:complete
MVMRAEPQLMAHYGDALPEVWLFADTGDEPAEVYDHVKTFGAAMAEAGLRLETVTAGTLSEHVIGRAMDHQGSISMPPMFVADKTGGPMPVRRGCTSHYKGRPLDRFARQWFDVKRGYRGDPYVAQWYGISCDESQRMRVAADPKDSWRVFEYPLVRMGWSRRRCLDYLAEHGVVAPRSACVYCPFHSNAEWLRIKAQPDEWRRVVEFERSMHAAHAMHGDIAGLRSKPYLHRSRVPIDQVEFDGGQATLWDAWDDECAGVCGV